MKDINQIAIIVQSRLNSQRVPKKMLKDFNGTNLFDICLNKIANSKIIPKNNIYISVFEEELRNVAQKHELNIFDRSEKSANAESSLQEIYEWHDKLPENFKYVFLINPCSPFLKIETIEEFFLKFLEINEDGMFGVIKKKNYFWNKNGIMVTNWPEHQTILNTKAVEITYEAAHCLYASRLDTIKNDLFMGSFKKKDDPVLFEMEEFEVFDIDYHWQFEMAKSYYKDYQK